MMISGEYYEDLGLAIKYLILPLKSENVLKFAKKLQQSGQTFWTFQLSVMLES